MFNDCLQLNQDFLVNTQKWKRLFLYSFCFVAFYATTNMIFELQANDSYEQILVKKKFGGLYQPNESFIP